MKKSASMQYSVEEFLEKQRRLELKSVENSVAKTLLVESVDQFSWKYQCRTQYRLKYCYRPSDCLSNHESHL